MQIDRVKLVLRPYLRESTDSSNPVTMRVAGGVLRLEWSGALVD
jgi:hypothetical protein